MPNASLARYQEQLERQHQEVRRYLPDLLMRLVKSLGIPLFAALIMATAGGVLIARVLPSSTTSIILLGINIVILYYGWQTLNKRYQTTALFLAYTQSSRDRRILRDLLAQSTSTPEGLQQASTSYQQSAQQFINAMRQAGAQATPQ